MNLGAARRWPLNTARAARNFADRHVTGGANSALVRRLQTSSVRDLSRGAASATNVILPAAFGSLGDEALAAGTMVGAKSTGLPIRIWAPGNGDGWPEARVSRVQSLTPIRVGNTALLNAGAREMFGGEDVCVIGADTIGGDYLHGFLGYRVAALRQAVKNGRRAQLVNFSLGRRPTGLALALLRSLPSDVQLWARDELSRERGIQFLGRDVGLAPDIGALTQQTATSASCALVSRQSAKSYIVLIPNAHFETMKWLSRREIIASWVELAVHLSDSYSVVFLPHDLRPRPGDVALAQEIALRLVHMLDSPIEMFVPLTSGEAKHVIANSAGVISARMHGCVAALSSGIPCLGIEYLGKFVGQFRWFGDLGAVVPLTGQVKPQALSRRIRELIAANSGAHHANNVVKVEDFGWLRHP